MAEFVEVMRTARRMCKSIDDCGDCPFLDASIELCCLNKYPKGYNDKDFIRHEAAIMKWGAENPESRYPTWREWSDKQFPDASESMRTCAFMSKERANCMAQDMCDTCRNQPIPADIAKKLGIQPIPVEPQESIVDEYEHTKNRAYNLNHYLNWLNDVVPEVFEKALHDFSGMPGYTRE